MRKLRPRGLGMFYKLSQLTDSRAGVQIQAMELQALCYDLCATSLQLNIGKFLWKKKNQRLAAYKKPSANDVYFQGRLIPSSFQTDKKSILYLKSLREAMPLFPLMTDSNADASDRHGPLLPLNLKHCCYNAIHFPLAALRRPAC